MTQPSETLVERLYRLDREWQVNCDEWEQRIREKGVNLPATTIAVMRTTWHREAADRLDQLEAENERLRIAIANMGNGINVEGSPFHRAQVALDEIVSSVKQATRAALKEITP